MTQVRDPVDRLNEDPGEAAAQILTFTVDDRVFGIRIETVRQIVPWTRTTSLPGQPAYSCGVLNLRGMIVPVNDLRARLDGEHTKLSGTSVVVIAAIGCRTVGILVDAVSDILSVPQARLREPPSEAGASACVALFTTADERVVTVLDLPALFPQPSGRD